jgi:hypothetical protein
MLGAIPEGFDATLSTISTGVSTTQTKGGGTMEQTTPGVGDPFGQGQTLTKAIKVTLDIARFIVG